MTRTEEAPAAPRSVRSWLMKGVREEHPAHLAAHPSPQQTEKTHHWWQVMCLTGVDYFSTLGYQPGIAALAAGAISPIATVVLVALTLLGALPVYRRVARESPNGEGSLAMLERLLSFWKGKIFVLVLLGFAATDFIITMTLSAADATAHLVENPHLEPFLTGHQVAITLVLLALLGAVFLRGFKEAIGVAVILVAIYLALNIVVITVAFGHVAAEPFLWSDWKAALTQAHGNPWVVVGIALLVFPKLALGLSGFETGVAVMPHIKGDPEDTPAHPVGRIRGAKRLLTTAAVIMSIFLITSSVVTTLLIPPAEFQRCTSGALQRSRRLLLLRASILPRSRRCWHRFTVGLQRSHQLSSASRSARGTGMSSMLCMQRSLRACVRSGDSSMKVQRIAQDHHRQRTNRKRDRIFSQTTLPMRSRSSGTARS